MEPNTAVLAAITIAVIVVLSMALARAILGPTVYDRILAVNMIGTKTVVIIALVGFLDGRPDFLDIALLYALINFIGTIAVLKFLRYGDLGKASEDEGDI
jgi:multicomponent Na+:H+ antiporter subunit F